MEPPRRNAGRFFFAGTAWDEIGARGAYLSRMTRDRAPLKLLLALPAFLLLAAPAAQAQDGRGQEDRSGPILPNDEDLRALGDFAERMMREFRDQVAPLADRLGALIDDIDAYEAPERLPNGDIIIRRKSGAPLPEPAPEDAPPPEDGYVDL